MEIYLRDSLISGLFGDWGYIGRVYIFLNSDFYFEGKKLEKKLVCYLTSQYYNVEEEFRVKFQSLIDECNANNIELKLNDKIIK